MGGFNLGGFGGQLTADELQRALAAVNGGRMDPAMDAPQLQQPPPVMPQEPPPPVQEEPLPDDSITKKGPGKRLTIDNYYGALAPGNVDLDHRPHVKNADGSTSTVRSMSFQEGSKNGSPYAGKEILVPTVSDDGRILTNEEAIAEYDRTGKHLGVYETSDDATAAGHSIHLDQMSRPPMDTLPVTRESGGPKKAIEKYQDRNLTDANRRIMMAGESGDSTGQDAKSYDAQAEIRGRQAQQTKSNIDTARSQVEERRQHERRYQQDADRLYEEMRAHTQPPPQSTMSKVLGIVGAVASMGGNTGMGRGLGMLSSMLGSDTERWAAEQQANSGLYQAALASVGSDRQGMQSDLDVAQRMTALEAHEIDASLEQVKAMGLSRNATRTAEDLQLAMRQKVRDGLIDMEAAKAKAAAARGSSAQRDAAWRMDLEDLRKLASGVDVVVNGQTIRAGIGEDWQKILAERTKADQAYRGGEADIRKKQGEAGTGEGQEVLPGMIATVPLEKKDVSDIRANAQVLSKIKGNYAKLTEIRERNKGNPVSQWTNKDDAVLAQNIISEMTGVMNQFSGRGAPSNLELDDMKKQLLDPTDNYVLTDPVKVYQGQMERLERNFQAGLDAVGVQPRGRSSGGGESRGGGQPGSGDPRVRSGFSAPTAGSVGIRRDANGGIALPQTRDPSPQELARAYLSEEGVPEEWLK